MRSSTAIPAFVLLSLLAMSCGLFDTRDPEDPSTGNETLPPATTPDILLSNFTTAFSRKNIQEYEKLFADTATHDMPFTFIPNQAAAVRYQAVFAAWDKSSESDYFRKIVSALDASSSPQISFGSVAPVHYQSDSALYTVTYSIFVPHKRSDLTTQFEGRSEFAMSPNKNNIWMIYRWTDFETKKDSSWSELKGQFYSK